jgi:hypothetical protein
MKEMLVHTLIAIFGVNWKTTLNGWLLLVCGGEAAAAQFDLVHMMPPEWQTRMQAICFLFMAFGLLGAKDNNVTNSIVPSEPKKVPAAVVGGDA